MSKKAQIYRGWVGEGPAISSHVRHANTAPLATPLTPVASLRSTRTVSRATAPSRKTVAVRASAGPQVQVRSKDGEAGKSPSNAVVLIRPAAVL